MFKIGDRVRAITNNYGVTIKQNEWEGRVIEVNGHRFDAITTNNAMEEKIGRNYYNLEIEDFELIEPNGLEGAVKLI